PLVAKLERHEVFENLPGILTTVDAVMVARGDLGVDVPLEDVPLMQKEIIRQARAAKIPVIVATQMLESMVTHLRPTRAEVSDVATAIFEGADAVMLSAETATGRYPAEAVETMARIAVRAEESVLADEPLQRRRDVPIIAFTPTVDVRRRLALSWGVSTRLIRKVETTDEMVEEIESALLRDGLVRVNDVIVIISGAPMWVTGTTNLMKLHRIGERR